MFIQAISRRNINMWHAIDRDHLIPAWRAFGTAVCGAPVVLPLREYEFHAADSGACKRCCSIVKKSVR